LPDWIVNPFGNYSVDEQEDKNSNKDINSQKNNDENKN
jgi:hypothetical protein